MTTVTAIMRQRNGERPALYWMFHRPSPAVQEECRPIDGDTYYDLWHAYHNRAVEVDGGLVTFDPDRPIEWDDVMPEGR